MLSLDDTGRGDPLVLVHGLATTRLIWRHVIPSLAQDRRVAALDVPGFGSSPPAGPRFALDAVADALAEGLDAAGIPAPFDVVGHSMGGAVALTLAARHPERVRSLVLFAPAGMRPMPAALARALGPIGAGLIHARRLATPLADIGWARRLLLAAGTVDGAAVPPSDARAMLGASQGATRIAAALTTVTSEDLRPLLDQAPERLGLLWGGQDRIIPPDVLHAVLEHRPDALVASVPGAGHIAMMERPQAFADALIELLDALAAS